MAGERVSALAPASVSRRLSRLPAPGSMWWPAGVAAAFTASQLLFVSPHMGLSWDETVYVSQFSAHAPAAYFDPARARGVPLLVAPVVVFTSSIVVLRVYLALASGAALAGALWAWRPLRPAWVLALAGVSFGGLWVAQYYGPQAMPDEWVALSCLAAVGFFLRAASGHGWRGPLAGLTLCLAAATLFRPGDAVFIAVPLALAVPAIAEWRRWQLLACVAAGLIAGGAEWVIEAYLRFGGVMARLHAAGAEQGGLGLHLGIWDELKAVNGPTLCRPCTVGWRYPELSLWWLALPALVALGLAGARRAGTLRSSALAAACGLAAGMQYLFLVGYGAPRFLLPMYALLAIPVADGLGWLVSSDRPERREVALPAVAALLIMQVLVQHVVLDHEAGGTVVFHQDYSRAVADLSHLGLRPPCLVKGEQDIPIAFYAGCASAPRVSAGLAGDRRVVVLEHPGHRAPRYARRWLRRRLAGTGVLDVVAYLPPRSG